METKPLFVPLVGWAYDQFAAGVKSTEFRRYGPRWNERTCALGRPVVLSRGYGLEHRLNGAVFSFTVLDAPLDLEAWVRAFGVFKPGEKVAAIGIKL